MFYLTHQSPDSRSCDTKLKMGSTSPAQTEIGRSECTGCRKYHRKWNGNIVTNELHRAKKISTDFEDEKKEVKKKYDNAGYLKRFVDSIITKVEEIWKVVCWKWFQILHHLASKEGEQGIYLFALLPQNFENLVLIFAQFRANRGSSQKCAKICPCEN